MQCQHPLHQLIVLGFLGRVGEVDLTNWHLVLELNLPLALCQFVLQRFCEGKIYTDHQSMLQQKLQNALCHLGDMDLFRKDQTKISLENAFEPL